MHRYSSIRAATHICGRRYFGHATATQLKMERQEDAPAPRIPSRKTWDKPSEAPTLGATKDLGKWARSPVASPAPNPTYRTRSQPAPTNDRQTRHSNDHRLTPPVTSPAPNTTYRTSSQPAPTNDRQTRHSNDRRFTPRNAESSQRPPQRDTRSLDNSQSHDRRGSNGPSTGTSFLLQSTSKWAKPLPDTPTTTPPSNSNSISKQPVSSSKPAGHSPRIDYSATVVAREEFDSRRDRGDRRRTKDSPVNKTMQYQKQSALPEKPAVKKTKKPKRLLRRRKDLFIPTTVTVAMLARLMNVKMTLLVNRMRRVGMESEANYDYILSADYAALLADEFGFNPVVDDEAAFDIYPPKSHQDLSNLPARPPIVTIMGHVDHGKTTLLDTLRSASVAKGEAGGITQHIGAFSVPVATQDNSSGPRSITFLDTPGHAAFSAMRARGANVTDIIVLVVAADDGIMPQTKEVISLLKKDDSQVDLVVAINKIDRPSADIESVKKALMAEDIQLEDFGGDVPAVHVSGLTGQGLPELIETLSTVAEVRDLRAPQDGPVYGHVLESNVHKGLGSVATVLIRQGCLKVGSHIISGTASGKVRRMTDSSGKTLQTALPGMAVTVSGWKILPKAGDEVLDGSESDIKKAIVNRLRREEAEALQEDVEAINEARKLEREARAEGVDTLEPAIASGPKELRLVIKADVSGSGEALEGALNGIGNHVAISKVISTGVGDVTESDVQMAKAANATIVAFSVATPRSIMSLAARGDVPVTSGNIIYRLMDDVRSRIIDMLPKTVETKVVGEATVLQLFDITNKAKQIIKVAGCRVTNGLVEKQRFARVVRSGKIIHEGSLETLRQLKKEITEARKGMECGLSFKEFAGLQEGDLIQMYEKIEKPGVI